MDPNTKIFAILAAIPVLIMIGIFFIVSFAPSASYGQTNQKIRRGLWGSIKRVQPGRLWSNFISPAGEGAVALFNKRKDKQKEEPERQQQQQPKQQQKQQVPREPKSEFIYMEDCGKYRIGSKYQGEPVRFVMIPIWNQDDETWYMYLTDPHMPKNYDVWQSRVAQ